MIGLIDGDIIVFRCGFAAERTMWVLQIGDDIRTFEYKREATDVLNQELPNRSTRQEGKDFTLSPVKDLEPLSHALQNVKSLMRQLAEACDLNEFEMRVAFSDSPTFRHRLATTRVYKGNRNDEHRPTYEHEIKDFIKSNWDSYQAEDEEADDLLGIWQTSIGPHDSVIVSLDKDLNQIPGLKYNWLHGVRYDVTEAEAIKQFHLQVMTGDSTDNIPGLPGIGPGKAQKALHGLETPEEQWAEVCRMYQIHSGTEDWKEYLTEQGRLVWIRRKPGELWTPPEIEEDYIEQPEDLL